MCWVTNVSRVVCSRHSLLVRGCLCGQHEDDHWSPDPVEAKQTYRDRLTDADRPTDRSTADLSADQVTWR